jgi:hypothetical protein
MIFIAQQASAGLCYKDLYSIIIFCPLKKSILVKTGIFRIFGIVSETGKMAGTVGKAVKFYTYAR